MTQAGLFPYPEGLPYYTGLEWPSPRLHLLNVPEQVDNPSHLASFIISRSKWTIRLYTTYKQFTNSKTVKKVLDTKQLTLVNIVLYVTWLEYVQFELDNIVHNLYWITARDMLFVNFEKKGKISISTVFISIFYSIKMVHHCVLFRKQVLDVGLERGRLLNCMAPLTLNPRPPGPK